MLVEDFESGLPLALLVHGALEAVEYVYLGALVFEACCQDIRYCLWGIANSYSLETSYPTIWFDNTLGESDVFSVSISFMKKNIDDHLWVCRSTLNSIERISFSSHIPDQFLVSKLTSSEQGNWIYIYMSLNIKPRPSCAVRGWFAFRVQSYTLGWLPKFNQTGGERRAFAFVLAL